MLRYLRNHARLRLTTMTGALGEDQKSEIPGSQARTL
jgi:hypothetical protein